MQHMNPVNPALASLLQVANMVTPDQTPTVAAQVASAAEQKFAPQMSMPSVQNVAQDAGIGGQVGAYQQQQQQQQMMQALQQMMQRQQAQDNAMRFGVAAAPGAQTVRAAAGGIMHFDAGGLGVEEMLGAAGTGKPYTGRNLLELLTSAPEEPEWKKEARLARETAARQTPEAAEAAKFAQDVPYAPGGKPAPEEGAPVRGQGIMAVAPQRAPAPVKAPQLAGPSAAQQYLDESRRVLGEYETEAPKPSEITRQLGERDIARDAYLRSRGVDPDQYKRDIERSQEREQRKLAGIETLRKESEAANTGIRGLVKLLSAAGGRTDPLTAIGVQYGNMTAQQLADNEKFMKAREEVMDNEDKIQATIREKRRAEVTGDYKAQEEAARKEQELRNKKRDAQITLATETAKFLSGKEEKQLDRETQVLTTKMHTDAQREVAAATREGTLETRRASILANISRAEQSEIGKAQSNFNKRLTSIGIFPGVKPTPDQVKALQEAQAEYDLRVAGISRQAAEDRSMVMGGTGGGAFKVERVK